MGLYQALMALKVFVICSAMLAFCTEIPDLAAAPASDTGKILLIYVYSPDCGACRQFDREIGPIYPKTTEAARLPLHKVLLGDWQTGATELAECATDAVVGTPTFLQVQDCRELDRITGYSDAELFWLSLRRMINRLDPTQDASSIR
ncbi:thioredoxin family protein [Luminiphilus sp.]|nr:thioredoxin family protein [Luminiphilus sp.]